MTLLARCNTDVKWLSLLCEGTPRVLLKKELDERGHGTCECEYGIQHHFLIYILLLVGRRTVLPTAAYRPLYVKQLKMRRMLLVEDNTKLTYNVNILLPKDGGRRDMDGNTLFFFYFFHLSGFADGAVLAPGKLFLRLRYSSYLYWPVRLLLHVPACI